MEEELGGLTNTALDLLFFDVLFEGESS